VRNEGQGGDEEQGEGVLVGVLHGALFVDLHRDSNPSREYRSTWWRAET
jgi:hypothetical protein